MIAVKKISKSCGAKEVLREISFSIERGEIVGFIGANGSGKTTTMRAIMGLLSINSGEIEIDGFKVGREEKLSRFLGYLPEERGLYMNDSLLSQLHYFGELQGMGRDVRESRIDYLLERLAIERYRYADLRDLSLGNQQRVQIAVALLHSPRYLILDEPFSGLDPSGIQVLMDFIREESAAGVGAIFSSHILPYVEELSHKILLLSDGKIHPYTDSRAPLADFYQLLEASRG